MSEYTDEKFVPEKDRYAETLSEFIKCKTISDERFFDKTEFDKFLSFIKGRFRQRQMCIRDRLKGVFRLSSKKANIRTLTAEL